MFKNICKCKITVKIEKFLEPILLLLIRIFMWNVFFTSGKLKLDNYLNDDWESTLFLFKEVHPVPFLPINIAAIMGTGGEIILSSILLVGFMGRFGAFGLLIMTSVIEFSFQYNDPEYTTLPMHMMWALLLGTVFVRGSGSLSLDGIFNKFLQSRS